MPEDRTASRMLLATFKRAALPVAGGLGFLLIWEAIVRVFGIRDIVLPTPSAILAEIADAPIWFVEQTLYTTGITLVGFFVAVVFGVLFAVLITEWRPLERVLFPLFVALNGVPKVAIAPLFIIWFGTGVEPKIAISFLVAVFAVVIDTVLGLRSASPDTLDLARVLRGSRLKVLLRIKLYCALPHMFAGFKVAMSLALVGAIVGEFVTSQRGLGFVILTAQGSFDTTRVFAAILLLSVLGLVLLSLVDLAERLALPWRKVMMRTGH